MSRYDRQNLVMPNGMRDNGSIALAADSRAAQMIGLATPNPGAGTAAFWKKIVQLNSQFDPSGQISGVFQYFADDIADDLIIVFKNGGWYSCSISANAPQTTPDALNFTSTQLVAITDDSGITFDSTKRVRAVQFNSEMIFVQDGGVFPVRFNGTNIYKLGIDTPNEVADGGNIAGVLTVGANYGYALTYADEFGRESSPSTPRTITMGAGGGRTIDWDLPTDAQVQRIYLYRTNAGGTVYYRVEEDGFSNVTDTYNDNTITDTLISFNTQAPLQGQNDPPQEASLIAIYKFRIALNSTENPRLLQLSNSNLPGSFSQLGALYNSNTGQLVNATDGATLEIINQFGEEIVALGHLGSVLGIWNRHSVGVFQGDNPAQYAYQSLHWVGCIAPDSVMECGNETVFMSEDGLYSLDYQSGFSINKISEDMDALFQSPAVKFDPPGDWPPTTSFTREERAKTAISTFLQNRYVLVTPPYTVIFDFDTRAMCLDYVTGMPDPDSGGYSRGYQCMSRISADRQYDVALYSPGYGDATYPVGDLYVMSYYPLTQTTPGVPEPNPFVLLTRAMDGGGVARNRLKRFRRTTLFGTILPGLDTDGNITAAALFNGTISLVFDDGTQTDPYFYDNLSQISTDFAGADFASLAKRGILIQQEWPIDAVGRACQVLIQGEFNGRLQIYELLMEYIPLSGG